MEIVFSISLVIFLITLMLLILDHKYNFLNDFVAGVIFFFCIAFALGGLVILPITVDIKAEYIEITNCNVIKDKHAIILDMTNSPQKHFTDIIKFNSHEFVETYNDSVKFFMEKRKSFYRVTTDINYVWSKPPYKYYNKE